MARECVHGSLARSCELCELVSEVRRLRAGIRDHRDAVHAEQTCCNDCRTAGKGPSHTAVQDADLWALLGDQEATDATTGDIVTEAIDRAGELRRAVEAHPPGPGTYDSKVVLALLDVVDAAAPLVSHVGESQDGEWDAAEERLADALARFGRLYS